MEKKIYAIFRLLITTLSVIFLIVSISLGIYGAIKYSTKTDVSFETVNVPMNEPSISYDALINELAKEDLEKGKSPASETRKDKIPTNLRSYFDSIKWSVRDFLAKSGKSQDQIDRMMNGFEDQLFDITSKFGEFQEASLKNLQAQMNKLLEDYVNLQNIKDGKATSVTFEKFFPWFLKKFNAALQAERDRVLREEQKQRDVIAKKQQALFQEKELGQNCLLGAGISFGIFLSLSTLVALFGIEDNTRKAA